MQQLWPRDMDASASHGADVGAGSGDMADLLGGLVERAQWVAGNFVTAVDGAVTVGGRSGPLGGDGDRAMFTALRDLSDVVVVGAGTARIENYGPTSLRAADVRRARGQQARPVLVLVTGSGDVLGLDRLWADEAPPIVVAVGAEVPDAHRRALTARGAEMLVAPAGIGQVDLMAVVAHLQDRGLGRILCEGGPHLFRGMLAAELVTDLFTTIAPMAVGGPQTMIATRLAHPLDLELAAVRMHGDELFLHHRVRTP